MAKQPKPLTRRQKMLLAEIERVLAVKPDYRKVGCADLDALERHGKIKIASKVKISDSGSIAYTMVPV